MESSINPSHANDDISYLTTVNKIKYRPTIVCIYLLLFIFLIINNNKYIQIQ